MITLWLCAFGYALLDYLIYGWVQDENHDAPLAYRVFQALLWVPIMLLLDWHDRIAFFLLWWTFVLDWIYYAFTFQYFMDKLAHVLRMSYGVPKVGWDDFEDTEADFANGITHAYWTPVGILMGFNKSKSIPVWVLVVQSCVGIYLSAL